MSAVVASSAAELVERILAEGPIGVSQACKIFGTFREGKRVHPSTITRWWSEGVKLANGRVVKLECVKIAGRLSTSKAAVMRFITEQQDTTNAPEQPTSRERRSPAQRQKDSEAADRELQKLGV
ncbi:MAG: DUF1580 domain-containing protein [Planctomycetes bacterium]|nr:DUF1580 domain-containing protein [Planctomycetota bacterium]